MGSEALPAGDEQRPAGPTEVSFVRLADAYRKEGLLEDAARICRDGLQRFPTSWAGRLILGKILLEQGAVEAAYRELDVVRRDARGRVEILAALEEALKGAPPVDRTLGTLETGERSVAPPSGEGAVHSGLASAAPTNDPLASPTLAQIYASQGETAKADAILRQIAREDGGRSASGEPTGDRTRQRYLKKLDTFRSVVQRQRQTRQS